MEEQLAAEILVSESDEIADLKANLPILKGFIELARQIDAMQDISKRFFEESRSLYQCTSNGCTIKELEAQLASFFGTPVKPAGKALPRKFRRHSTVKYLGGIQKDQSLFLLKLTTGEFYGALWPWRRNKNKIEIHLGYCSDWMVDEDYQQLETLIKRCISYQAFSQMDTGVGGQIQGIGLPSFLQMAEMESSNLTLRITAGEYEGMLYLSDGKLISAKTEELTGRSAAYRIISWDDALIQIEPPEEGRQDEINQPLMHVLMESLKIKDEIASQQMAQPAHPKARVTSKVHQEKPPGPPPGKRLVRLERAPAPRQPKKRNRLMTMAIFTVGLLVVLGAVLVVGIQIYSTSRDSDIYQQLLSQVQKAGSPEFKIDLLQQYIQANPHTEHAQQIQQQIDQAHQEIEDLAFEQMTLKISTLSIDETYEKKAISFYSEFLEKYPQSRHMQQINQSIAEIKNLLDQYYYEELKQAARMDFETRLKIYNHYLSRFPEGSFRQDVEILINEMGRKHFEFVKQEVVQCEQNQHWDPCIRRCEVFIDAYAGKPLSNQALSLKTELMDKRDVNELHHKVQAAGSDYQKAYNIYREYLGHHPQSTQKTIVEAEMNQFRQKLKAQRQWLIVKRYATSSKYGIFERIQRLDRYINNNSTAVYVQEAQNLMEQLEANRLLALRQQQAEAQKLEAQARLQQQKEAQEQRRQRIEHLGAQMNQLLHNSTRFQSNDNGIVTDLTTGLTWCLLDSYQELDGCLTYADALKFIKELRHGGFSDWRLPTAAELAGIYKKEPFFPGTGAKWYWTSEAYVKGYHSVANVVTADPETVYQRVFRRQDQCGSVRAVRQ